MHAGSSQRLSVTVRLPFVTVKLIIVYEKILGITVIASIAPSEDNTKLAMIFIEFNT